MSVPRPRGTKREPWQYHSRSDLHSKVGCWGVIFDLLNQSRVLREHALDRKVVFGVNHEMRDHVTGRKKNLDLVIARPSAPAVTNTSLEDLARRYTVVLTPSDELALAGLPALYEGPVGAVLIAVEAKAAMTEHSKARPRLYDELNSSHLTVHGASNQALAVGLVMVNASPTFISPDLNRGRFGTSTPLQVTKHDQPAAAAALIAKVREIPRRSGASGTGYDGLGVVVVVAGNDGSPITLVTDPPAPSYGDVLHYATMITRVGSEYDTSFGHI